MTVNFMHIRNTDQYGQVSNHGGITIAYREVSPTIIEFAVAKCSDKDNFNKAYGRAKAQGRMNSPAFRKNFVGTFQSFRESLCKTF